MAIIVNDSFTRANANSLWSADTGQLWKYSLNAIFGIYNNKAYIIDVGSNPPPIAYIDAGKSDVTITTKVAKFNDSYACIVRYNPVTQWGITIGASGKVEIHDGNFSAIATSSIEFKDNDIIKVVLKGNLITVYCNGVQCINVTTSFCQNETCHGIGNWQSSGAPPTFEDGAVWSSFMVEDSTTGTNHLCYGKSNSLSSISSKPTKTTTAVNYSAYGNINNSSISIGKPIHQELLNNKIIVKDSFNRPDNSTSLGSAETGQPWSVIGSTWGISSNMAKHMLGEDGIAIIDSGVSDCLIRVKCINKTAGIGVIFRQYQSAIADCFHLQWEPDWEEIAIYQIPSWATVFKVSQVSNFSEFAVELKGNLISVYVDGIFKGSFTSNKNINETRHGLGTWLTGAIFDDFHIENFNETPPTGTNFFGYGKSNSISTSNSKPTNVRTANDNLSYSKLINASNISSKPISSRTANDYNIYSKIHGNSNILSNPDKLKTALDYNAYSSIIGLAGLTSSPQYYRNHYIYSIIDNSSIINAKPTVERTADNHEAYSSLKSSSNVSIKPELDRGARDYLTYSNISGQSIVTSKPVIANNFQAYSSLKGNSNLNSQADKVRTANDFLCYSKLESNVIISIKPLAQSNHLVYGKAYSNSLIDSQPTKDRTAMDFTVFANLISASNAKSNPENDRTSLDITGYSSLLGHSNSQAISEVIFTANNYVIYSRAYGKSVIFSVPYYRNGEDINYKVIKFETIMDKPFLPFDSILDFDAIKFKTDINNDSKLEFKDTIITSYYFKSNI